MSAHQVPDYWVRILDGDAAIGAGFFVTGRWVLTAKHTLHHVRSNDVDMLASDGRRIRGRIIERASGVDLALVEVDESNAGRVLPPRAGPCQPGDRWRSPYRPSRSDPSLVGSVLASEIDYECDDGAVVRALHLMTSLELGTYTGYSGAPIERWDEMPPGVLLGILLEQYPDRQAPQRSSNVLVAAAIRHAFAWLTYFGFGHLQSFLPETYTLPFAGPAGESAATGAGSTAAYDQAQDAVTKGEALLVAIEHWARRGLVDVVEVRQLRARVVERVIDKGLG